MALKSLLKRHFTQADRSAYETVAWKNVHLPSLDHDVEAPEHWSMTAVEIAATKYFRWRHGENSVRQLIFRVVKAVRLAGEWQGFLSGEAARIFEDELTYILLHQLASFNSPVYFNVGVFPAYGVLGSAENFYYNTQLEQVRPISSAYLHPQASACFIQDVQDDLIGIFDLLKSEAKLFKYGSGTGTNFSRLRSKGEPLEAGGESTGLISYLEIFDKAAQAIKSGGTTRRAAKMVILDADHPEIMDFIHWKRDEERKARVLLANGYGGGMEGEAFRTVSGQNSNNSVRVTDEFMRRAIAAGPNSFGPWELRARRSGAVVAEVEAAEILREMARAAWECADPGIQFHDTIQKWHMCPQSGPIRASNPCSEYMFLDNSACNLASLNLAAFLREGEGGPDSGGDFDWPAFSQCAKILLVAQEILVDYASYPTAEIAENSHRFRPLGLGYANLGGLLMRLGLPYESDEAARWTRTLTAALHGLALTTSAEMAEAIGAFAAWDENRVSALGVLELHLEASREAEFLPGCEWIVTGFEKVLRQAERSGLRNAQVTLLAPTGTIGLFMDCDTLGIEPDFALIKRKTLSSGGEMILVNRSVALALKRLGYSSAQIRAIEEHIRATGALVGAKDLRPEHESVFDCAVPPKGYSHRRVSSAGHLKIMAAAQPFLSGAISKTVNLPVSATVEDVERLMLEAWKLGLKALAVYRDGSKALQPLCAEC
jgi:ribonucleoside-diphosphate reductase alpha chain